MSLTRKDAVATSMVATSSVVEPTKDIWNMIGAVLGGLAFVQAISGLLKIFN